MNRILRYYRTRRDFLKTTAIIAVAGAIISQLWIAVRYLLSPDSREARQKWKVGAPEKFDIGITFIADAKTFILRDGNKFKALSAVCTHLGCTVKEVEEVHKTASGEISVTEFHCPCHGSKFNASGKNIAGPARKPLHYVQISLSTDKKQLWIDSSISVDSDYFLELL